MRKLLFILSVVLLFSACNDKENGEKLNVFTINKDIELGAQLATYLESDSSPYILLDSVQYSTAYNYLYNMRDQILNSGAVKYKDEFKWQLRIIHDDSTLNAFCAPGGYIYVYTGIIKYLDNDYALAGVLGHEMAHADKRHSTHQMTKSSGISLMFAAVGGSQSSIAQIAGNLISLAYSRADESQADLASVDYLCPTNYKADGAAYFFNKIGGESSPPEILSTHPNPENRVENIEEYAIGLSCGGTTTTGTYQTLLNSIPQ